LWNLNELLDNQPSIIDGNQLGSGIQQLNVYLEGYHLSAAIRFGPESSGRKAYLVDRQRGMVVMRFNHELKNQENQTAHDGNYDSDDDRVRAVQ
jgi:hypothetical protein